MNEGGTRLYFSYGSNMYSPRMRSRVPSARFVDIARLPGFCLAFRKRGHDGSAKCDVEPLENETVWGVLYRIAATDLDALDRAEGDGYRREPVVVTSGEGFVDAFTYRARADWLTEQLPFDWYRDLVAAGAREHGLPEPYTAAITALDAREDPDGERAAANRP